jgi:hypothetical protein
VQLNIEVFTPLTFPLFSRHRVFQFQHSPGADLASAEPLATFYRQLFYTVLIFQKIFWVTPATRKGDTPCARNS